MKVHLNDMVLVTTGKYRGKSGKVTRVHRSRNRIVVEKINIRTRHIKKTQSQPGQRIQFEAPFEASNVMVICPECKKATRVGHIILQSGRKQRVCKKCKQSLDTGTVKKTTKKR